ncbi:unnamed protein product [Arabis nemorensis]|uniref:Uncharacterized protein n=1 Tax=Arabis nemorensis TaxID=586526 RepID=A0A565BB57_9BRAS|nr:unnamed protein product [Arabis nemorensis]
MISIVPILSHHRQFELLSKDIMADAGEDPSVSLIVYQSLAQTVTCGIFIPAERVSFTVTFFYGFNSSDDRQSLWDELSILNATTPISRYLWAVVGNFNQILRVFQLSNSLEMDTDDAELFEAQAKGLQFSWWNNQDDNPISKKIDHAFINRYWLEGRISPSSSSQFKLIRSLKMLKHVLRRLNKSTFSAATLNQYDTDHRERGASG